MRVDANVSLRPRGEVDFGIRAEVKNMNSFKSLHDALAYEIVRQAEVLEAGGRIVQETRLWDAGASARARAQQGRGARLPLLPRTRHGALRVLG